MKKIFVIIVLLLSILLFSACIKRENKEEDTSVDLDLSVCDSIIVYSQVTNMNENPSEYLDKTIKMKGKIKSNYSEKYDTTYYFIAVNDATMCCEAYVEILWENDNTYPIDNKKIEIIGRFSYYIEDSKKYYCIKLSSLKEL